MYCKWKQTFNLTTKTTYFTPNKNSHTVTTHAEIGTCIRSSRQSSSRSRLDKMNVLTSDAAATVQRCRSSILNPLDSKGNFSGTSNNAKLVHWPLMGGLLHLVQRRGAWAGCGPAQYPPHQRPVYQSLYCYDGPLLCGFNVAIKGLKISRLA